MSAIGPPLHLLWYSAVKDVVLQLRPKFSEKQLLVSVVAGTKLKDLKVSYGFTKYYGVYVYLKNLFFRLSSETKNTV